MSSMLVVKNLPDLLCPEREVTSIGIITVFVCLAGVFLLLWATLTYFVIFIGGIRPIF